MLLSLKKLITALFVISWLLAGVGCSPASNKQPQPLASSGSTSNVLQTDNLLHQRLQAVLDADNAYAEIAIQATPTDQLDAQNEAITTAEIALKQTIDSLEQTAATGDTAGQLQHTLHYFKNALQSRGALSDMRMVLSANSDDSTTMQHKLAQLRTGLQEKNKEVQEKDKKIVDLERTLGHMSSMGTIAENNAASKLKSDAYAQSQGESPAELKQRNKNLYLAYSSLQNKYFIVGRNYLLLKQEHERTLNELAALRKGNQK